MVKHFPRVCVAGLCLQNKKSKRRHPKHQRLVSPQVSEHPGLESLRMPHLIVPHTREHTLLQRETPEGPLICPFTCDSCPLAWVTLFYASHTSSSSRLRTSGQAGHFFVMSHRTQDKTSQRMEAHR